MNTALNASNLLEVPEPSRLLDTQSEVVEAVRLDAHIKPAGYLSQSVVEFGGE